MGGADDEVDISDQAVLIAGVVVDQGAPGGFHAADAAEDVPEEENGTEKGPKAKKGKPKDDVEAEEIEAEAVETDVQAERLRALRCDTGQGRYFGAPAPADAITARLRGDGVAA